MSTINVLGPVGFNPTGPYDVTRTYQKLDVVYYQGSSYVAISDSLGQLPTNVDYWLCIATGTLKQFTYDSVAEMKIDNSLEDGMYVSTVGYYEANDGGAATYKITSEESETEYQEELENGLYATLIVDDVVNVKQFGAYGDNEHDDTIAINTAILYSDNLFIPKGIYLIEPNQDISSITGIEHGIIIGSNKNIQLDPDAVIQCKTNDYYYYQVIVINQANNVKISGGHIYGDKLTHTGSSSSEFGHVCYLYSSTNVNIENCELAYGFGDSITIGAINHGLDPNDNCKNIIIDNCDIHDSRRQGISIISCENSKVSNCHIYNISGTAPQSGIDIESNYGTNPVDTILIENCIFNNNTSNDIIVTQLAKNVKINNCKSALQILVQSTSTETYISNCIINGLLNNSSNKLFVYDSTITGTYQNGSLNNDLTLMNCYIKGQYLNYSTEAGTNKITLKNCVVDYDGGSTTSVVAFNAFYTRKNTILTLDSCQVNLNCSISASAAKEIYCSNSNIITTFNQANGFLGNKVCLVNNVFSGGFAKLVGGTITQNSIIKGNTFITNPIGMINEPTGIVTISDNTSISGALNIITSSNIKNNNNFYQ